ncbi:MspA family porin [Mycolicibacterium mucogenicum]|uniref:MspA family porin n=1 Tax=Mycolicibacterium mucogenicum TaxID=56689 RepID=UPI001F2624ED|nr:MspA family porin [Mycolicibacterium mucogenicum]
MLTAVATIQLLCAIPTRAALDNHLSVVDEQNRTLTIQQWDTSLQGIASIDRNRLSREWFYSGRVVYEVIGPHAEKFEGQLVLGYQIGFPWSMGVGINFSYTSPNVLLDGGPWTPGPNFAPLASVITPNLLPGLSMVTDLGNGPGVVNVDTFTANVSGAAGDVLVSDAHGTVTGAAGGVLLRPYARLLSKDGASITTYGSPWNLN